jgi:glucose-6-phosphate isomerase
MEDSIAPLTTLPTWQALANHYPKVRELHLRKLFADDAKRGERMAAEAIGIYFDYSKQTL